MSAERTLIMTPASLQAAIRGLFQTLFLLFCIALFGGTANAQVVRQYTNTTDSAANAIGSATPCTTTGVLRRDFVVTDNFTVTNVRIGVLIAHSYRADLELYLQSPDGSIFQLKGATGGAATNLNVLFDSAAGSSITGHTANDTATAATIVPPYQRTFQPVTTLANFNGKDSFGTWQLLMCDNYPTADNGTFYQADLYLTQPAASADLSLTKTVASSSPSTAVYTLTVSNTSGSTLSASGVTVRDILPAGISYVSSSGTGTFNSGTGTWTPGVAIAPGQSVSINLNVNVTAAAGTTITNTAQIMTSSAPDPDSTPGNGVTSEDDYASNSFTVGGRIPGIAPNINSICSAAGAGTTILDWNTQSWVSGSTTGSANVANLGTVNFAVVTQGAFDAPLELNTSNTGGLGIAGLSLFQSIQYTNITQVTTTTITLPTAVPGVQFTVFDVDYAVNDFADKLTVTGSFNGGAPINATLTNNAVNYISGNSAIGDGGAAGNTPDGNVVITFSQPVDTITIVYGNHTTAPADPDGQAISIHDFTFCRPVATLSVSKISSVLSDPVSSSNPKAIPGATVRYCILVSNAGSATATNVSAADNLPARVTYVPGTLQSGINCSTGLTAEDDNATGADESDPRGMNFAAGGTNGTGIVSGSTTSLAPGGTMSMVFNVTVN